jgi:hypothetical protein
MSMIKLKTGSAFAVASLFVAPSLFAQIIGTGSLYITAPNYSSGGDQAGPYVVQNLTVSTGVTPASTFQTFCIGSQVDYTPGNTYNYQISDTVQPASGVGSPGYVTWGTAYLYNQFLAGLLGVGGSTTISTPGNAINDALQAAIWDLQGQSLSGITFSGALNMPDVNQFLNDAAVAAMAANVSSDENDASGAFGVYALNMLSAPGAYAQPELVQVPQPPLPAPVPETSTVFAGGLMLVPLGLSFLRRVRAKGKQS